MGAAGSQQRENENGGKVQQTNRFGEISTDVLRVECHYRQCGLLGAQCLLQLLGQCHHAGVGPRVPGTVVPHKQYLQWLPLGIFLITAQPQARQGLGEAREPRHHSHNIG